MINRNFLKVLAAGIFLILFAVTAALADEYGQIRGTVSDTTGAVIAGVQLTATNVATGIAATTTSKSDGSFEFLQLHSPATYKVTAQQSGFKGFQANDVQLSLNQIFVLNVTLELGSVSTQVTVEAAPAQVETTSMQLGADISGNSIATIPLNGRNWVNLQQTIPGVVASSDRFGSNFSTNGTRTQFNSYMVNGTDANDFPLNTPLVIPSPDAIAEVHIITNTINPEYGRDSGAIMNAVTKSGTNQFHGDGFEFFRDTSLDTRNFFSNNPGATSVIFHQNQFGGTIGGPIVKNHTFFFFSYQGTRNVVPQSGGTQTIPVFSQNQRNGIFADVAKSGTGSPFPMVGEDGVTHPAGTPYSTLFPTGHIPQADFNPISLNLMNTYVPLPNSGGNFVFNASSPGKADQEITRVDHTFNNSKDTLWFYWFTQNNPSQETLPFTGANLPGFGDQAQRHINNFTFAWDHTFGGSALNEARLGYSRFNFVAVQPIKAVLPASAGFTGINPQDPKNAGIPRISVSGLFTLGFSTNGPQPRIDQTRQFTDNFSKIIGRHTMKTGFEMRSMGVYNPFDAVNNGSFSFGGSGTFSTGDAGADYLLGIPDSYSQGSGDVIDARSREYYSYWQDQFKWRENFTLTYGLTWQVDTPITDIYHLKKAITSWRPGEQSTVFPTAPVGVVYPGDKGVSPSGYYTQYGHFGPRVGFAWSPNWGKLTGGPGKTSIRGGIGMYYNRTEEEVTLQNLGTPPYGTTSAGAGDFGGSPAFANPYTDISGAGSEPNKFPFANPAPGANIDFSQYEPMSLNIIDPNFGIPYAINYNLTLERELPGSMILSVAYVASLGRKLHTAYEINPGVNPTACATAGPGNPLSTKTKDPLTGQFETRCEVNRLLQQLVYPQNFALGATTTSAVASLGQQSTMLSSNYNSLQLSVNKRFSHGLQFLGSYTWSHALDYTSSLEDGAFGGLAIDPLNVRRNYGNAQFDARNRFVFSYIYNVPSIKRAQSNWVADRVLNGWEITGVTTLQSGFPVEITDGTYRELTCGIDFEFYNCWDRPNLVGPIQTTDIRSSSFANATKIPLTPGNAITRDHYFFNPNSFALEPFGTLGNVGRGVFHGPGINNFDFGFYKNVKITGESKYVQLRFEFYNLFNHTQFGNPNGNINSSNFGRTLSAASPRLIQLAAKIYF